MLAIALVIRTALEDSTLQKELPGYNEYTKTTRYRLIPWVHSDRERATDKAISLVNAAVERVKYSQPLDPVLRKTKKSALVVGGGISGITAALSLAKQGIKTCIVEEKPTVGGSMVQVGKVFSPEKMAEECAMTIFHSI